MIRPFGPHAVLVALFALLGGTSTAQAQQTGDTKEQAYQKCQTAREQQLTGYPSATVVCVDSPAPPPEMSGDWQCQMNGGLCFLASSSTFPYYGCPADKPWDSVSKTCGNLCAETKGAKLGSGISKGGNENACKAGCEYAPAGTSICMGVGEDAFCGSPLGYVGTGNSCPTESTPNPEACITSGGHTVCLKPDGSKCGQFNGRQVCFGNGETGIKTDGSSLVQAGAGSTPPTPPNSQLPSGDTLNRTGGPTTITSTTSVTNVTNVTNINTFGTTFGTNAGGTNQGGNTGGTPNTPGGGTGGGTGGTGGGSGGEEEGDENSAGGGGTCAAAPTCSGDAIACAALAQQWQARCEADGRWKGLGEEAAGLDQGDGYAGREGDSLWSTDDGSGFLGDESGLGFGTSCPAPPVVMGQELDFAALCEVMGVLGMLVLAAAHLHALYIIAGD